MIRLPALGLRALTMPRAPVGASYLLQDTFTDADNTVLTSHTMDVGAGWTLTGWLGLNEGAGQHKVQSNRARLVCPASAYYPVLYADAGSATVTTQADITPAADTNCYVVSRLTDGSNLWMFGIGLGAGSDYLLEINAGGITVRGSSAFAYSAGTTYEMRMVCSGTNISCYRNGGLLYSYGSATFNQSATRCGILAYGSTSADFDDFEVT